MIRDAATVMLLRGSELLLLRRHPDSGFFGDAYAFPGGKLDRRDYEPEMLARLPAGAVDRCAARLDATPGHGLSREQAAGLYVAACRELFEEAGVLLARRRDGSPFDGLLELHDELRERVQSGALAFHAALGELVLDVDRLSYVAHWITPSFESRRFDARFFLAVVGRAQTASRDQRETTEVVWRAPREVLVAQAQGRVVLPPPTLYLIEQLAAESGDAEAVRRAWGGRRVEPVLPKIIPEGDGVAVLLPWDPAYAAADGESLAVAPRVDGGPTRIVLAAGRWRSVRVASDPTSE